MAKSDFRVVVGPILQQYQYIILFMILYSLAEVTLGIGTADTGNNFFLNCAHLFQLCNLLKTLASKTQNILMPITAYGTH
jgi:hypothetical protein